MQPNTVDNWQMAYALGMCLQPLMYTGRYFAYMEPLVIVVQMKVALQILEAQLLFDGHET